MAWPNATIDVDNLEPGDFVDTGGVRYGPYDAVTCLAVGDDRIAVHIKGHYQFWSRRRNYIPAYVIVFERVSIDDAGRWDVKKVYEEKTGRDYQRVKETAISIALREAEIN